MVILSKKNIAIGDTKVHYIEVGFAVLHALLFSLSKLDFYQLRDHRLHLLDSSSVHF